MAQDANSGKLEEIIVTATRRELNLQNVAQSVSAFSTADIEKQAFRSVEDVIGALPSVNLINNQPGRNVDRDARRHRRARPSTAPTARSPSISTTSR